MLQLSTHYFSVLLLVACSVDRLLGQTENAQSRFPDKEWTVVEPGQVGLDPEKLNKASQRALEAEGAGMIVRHGLLVHHWGDTQRLYDLKSTSKSIGVTALGLALADGKLRLADKASQYYPALGVPPEENRQSGWTDLITIQQLATQTAGFAKPGGYQPLLFQPGTAWHYSDGGPNWLAECITKAYGRDVEELLFDRVFEALGITRKDLRWRDNQYREHELNGVKRREFGSGVHANVDAMARIGLLYLRKGKWRNEQLIPADFVDRASRAIPSVAQLPVFVAPGETAQFGDASRHYGLLWWNNADGTLPNVPRDAFWSWGLYDSLILVIPSLDIVATRTGKSWEREAGASHYSVLAPFFNAIVDAVVDRAPIPKTSSRAPYPRSELIVDVEWQPADKIIRLAEGSDNWPITWTDDGSLITAYGDGWGFKPKVERKLSLGLARIHGSPFENNHVHGENLRSSSIEQVGQGPQGAKPADCSALKESCICWCGTRTTPNWRGPPIRVRHGTGVSGSSRPVSVVLLFSMPARIMPMHRMSTCLSIRLTARPRTNLRIAWCSRECPKTAYSNKTRMNILRVPVLGRRFGVLRSLSARLYFYIPVGAIAAA